MNSFRRLSETIFVLAILSAIVVNAGFASRLETGNNEASTAVRNADQTFVNEAAVGGMAEVQLGQLARDKAASDEVKNFGQRMIDDHSTANDDLKQLASRKSIAVPSDVDAKAKAIMNRLSRLSGHAFDRAYMTDMVNDHVADVAAFRREARLGKDADVKAWAAKTLPTLEDHLKMARDVNRKVVTRK